MHPVEREVIGTVGRVVRVLSVNLGEVYRLLGLPAEEQPAEGEVETLMLQAAEVLEGQAAVLRELFERSTACTCDAPERAREIAITGGVRWHDETCPAAPSFARRAAQAVDEGLRPSLGRSPFILEDVARDLLKRVRGKRES